MLNTGESETLVNDLRIMADHIEQAALKNASIAEQVLDFERGVLTLPELLASAKEILDT